MKTDPSPSHEPGPAAYGRPPDDPRGPGVLQGSAGDAGLPTVGSSPSPPSGTSRRRTAGPGSTTSRSRTAPSRERSSGGTGRCERPAACPRTLSATGQGGWLGEMLTVPTSPPSLSRRPLVARPGRAATRRGFFFRGNEDYPIPPGAPTARMTIGLQASVVRFPRFLMAAHTRRSLGQVLAR